MKVIPTILTTNVDEWKEQMLLFPKYYQRIQLDIADGLLVPNTTTQIPEMIKALSTNEISLSKDITFDFHLMVEDYQRELENISKLRPYLTVNTILLNARLKPDMARLSKIYPNFDLGLDIDDKTIIDWLLKQFDLSNIKNIQIMTVHQGAQGNPFMPESLNKITQLRNKHYKDIIMIDGGVNEKTLKTILSNENLPDYICVGSYLTKAGSLLEERINYLNETTSSVGSLNNPSSRRR